MTGIEWTLTAPLAAGAAYWLGRKQAGRQQVYQTLAKLRPRLAASYLPQIQAEVTPELIDTFTRERAASIPDFLAPSHLEALRAEVLAHQKQVVRSYIPTHKKGGTISYERIHHLAPQCLALYHAPAFAEWISRLVGQRVLPTADHDQSSCSILVYDQAGDHINWHFDHNFYQGSHFTVLLALVNQSASGGNSASELYRKKPGGTEMLDTAVNRLVVFEGQRVCHRASPTSEGDLRILLSMTFATSSHIVWYKEVARRIKDTAFFGLRALWD